MNSTILRKKIVPLLAVSICSILYILGYFQILIGTFIVLIASLIEFRKQIFKSLGFQRTGLKIKNLLIIAPLVSGGIFLLYYFVLVPGVTYLTGQAMDFSDFDSFNVCPRATAS